MERSRVARREETKTSTKKSNRTKRPKKKKSGGSGGSGKGPLFKKLLMIATGLFIIMMLVGGGFAAYAIATAPELDETKLRDALPLKIYASNKEEIKQGGTSREYVSIKEVPEVVKDAFIAIEDRRFYQHKGIDFRRLGGAIIANITDGFGSEGASTITQQVIKQSFLSSEKTITRKVQEQWLAIRLEQDYTKDQILEMYLNKNYYGQNSFGIQTASKAYFNKTVDKLDYAEAAMLAGLPQRPTAYDPIKGDPKLTKGRQTQVLDAMLTTGVITQKQRDQGVDQPISKLIDPAPKSTTDASYDSVIFDMVSKELEDVFGLEGKDIYGQGLKIYTSIDKPMHDYMNEAIKEDKVVQLPDYAEAAASAVNTKTGEVLAVVDGKNPGEDTARRNYANEPHQPGSSAKPFFAYGPAIENEKWSTAKQITDQETKINGKTIQNYYDGYKGTNTIRNWLKISANTPAIQTFQEIGGDAVESFAAKSGLALEKDESISPAYAIGGMKHGFNTTEMAGAYATLGNGGDYVEPHIIKSIEYSDGSKIKSPIKSKKAMEDYTAYMLTDMLRDVLKPGGTFPTAGLSFDAAGKTGTTNAYKDVWFVGYTSDVSISVWTGTTTSGNNNGIGLEGQTESRMAQNLWKDFVTKTRDRTPAPFEQPSSVLSIGDELYVKGTKEPVVEKKAVPAPTGLQASYDEEAQSGELTWNYNDSALRTNGYDSVTFEVSMKDPDGNTSVLGTSSTNRIGINGLKPGRTEFTLVAKASGEESGPVATSVTVAEPETEEPVTDEPTTDEPATDEPATDEPATDEPTTDEPTTDEPATDEPTTDEPATDEPATDEPATDEPATDEPATDESVSTQSTDEKAKENDKKKQSDKEKTDKKEDSQSTE
ncbi:transglycosylase domain-containing protein [Exiguobacterium sp. s80]|uniref:transglycosylase domain-containing protein n=1 Tax=Exiguobacterium sp. s80 TaxID=2751209 RepID=UPI001BE8649E|nr:transglycosylase domain-containing protein [Exiguobacterium sp. s80]